MNNKKKNAGPIAAPGGKRKKFRISRRQWVCIALFAATVLVNAVSLIFLPETMGVPVSGMEHLNRISSALSLGAFTIMQGLLCYKGFIAGVIRCPVAGTLLFVLDVVLIVLNLMNPAGIVMPG